MVPFLSGWRIRERRRKTKKNNNYNHFTANPTSKMRNVPNYNRRKRRKLRRSLRLLMRQPTKKQIINPGIRAQNIVTPLEKVQKCLRCSRKSCSRRSKSRKIRNKTSSFWTWAAQNWLRPSHSWRGQLLERLRAFLSRFRLLQRRM